MQGEGLRAEETVQSEAGTWGVQGVFGEGSNVSGGARAEGIQWESIRWGLQEERRADLI